MISPRISGTIPSHGRGREVEVEVKVEVEVEVELGMEEEDGADVVVKDEGVGLEDDDRPERKMKP